MGDAFLQGQSGGNLNVLSVNQDVTKTSMNSAVSDNAKYNTTDSLWYGASNGDDYKISAPILAWNMSGTQVKTFNAPASYVVGGVTYTVCSGNLFAVVSGSYIYTTSAVKDPSNNYKWVIAKYDLSFNLVTAIIDNGTLSPNGKDIYTDGTNVYTIFFNYSTYNLELRKYDLNLSLVGSNDIGVNYTPAFSTSGFKYAQDTGTQLIIKHGADDGSFWFATITKSNLTVPVLYNTKGDVFYISSTRQLELKPLSNTVWASNVKLLDSNATTVAYTTLPIGSSLRGIIYKDYFYFKTASSDLLRLKVSTVASITSTNFQRYLQNVSLDPSTLITYVRFFSVISDLLYFKGDSTLYRIDSIKPTKY